MKLTHAFFVLLSTFAAFMSGATAGESKEGVWPALSSQSKPWTRWWWLGSAVDKANLTRELESLAAAGFGGVEITPIYGAKGAEARNIPFLSEKYLEMLAYTAAEAKRLGMGVDMATGTGWPFGGPTVEPRDAELLLDFKDGKIAAKPSGFVVKRAAPGGAGLVLDPYSPSAMSHYLEGFTRPLSTLPAGALRSQFHDSFEYKANWANEVPDKFIELHGYDLRDHAQELSGNGDADTVARIKADYRKTLETLHLEYIQTWVNWAHSLGELTREQAHGSPGNLLDLYAAADIPETELFGAQEYPIPGFRRDPGDVAPEPHPPVVHRLASSAAHVAGRPLASSETFTWLREHFREAPSQMKPEVDQLFLTGINHIFYHGTAYSPEDVPWPGWLFYASTEANPRNPLWSGFAQLNHYIARCQSWLQSGSPDNNLLVYWPLDDLWHTEKGLARRLSVHVHDWLVPSTAGKLANDLTQQGYSFDFISDKQVLGTRSENGELQTPGGSYLSLIVPKTAHMEPSTLKHLLDLAEAGACVLFLEDLPADVPGFGRLESRRDLLKQQIARLEFGPVNSAGMKVAWLGSGKVCVSESLPALLAEAKIPREPIADTGAGVIRRRIPEGFLYFVSNLSAKPVESWIKLGRPAHSALLMDPLTDRAGQAALRQRGDSAEIYLQLRPGESILIKTSNKPVESHPAWVYFQRQGTPRTIEGQWNLTFLKGGPELPAPCELTKLGSWAETSDPAAQKFGGTARYEIEFNLPKSLKRSAWRLDLGDVREIAQVTLNGEGVGNFWCLPFDRVLSSGLKPGRNKLSIEVTSTAANRIRDLDQRRVPWKNGKNFVNIEYKPFDASKWPLQPCGLLGPVRLVPLSAFNPNHAK